MIKMADIITTVIMLFHGFIDAASHWAVKFPKTPDKKATSSQQEAFTSQLPLLLPLVMSLNTDHQELVGPLQTWKDYFSK